MGLWTDPTLLSTQGLPPESTVCFLSPHGQPDRCILLADVKVEKSPRKSVQSWKQQSQGGKGSVS